MFFTFGDDEILKSPDFGLRSAKLHCKWFWFGIVCLRIKVIWKFILPKSEPRFESLNSLIYGKYFNKLSLIVEGKYRNIFLACVDLICKLQTIFKPFTCAHLLRYCGAFNQNYSSLGVLLPSWGCSFSRLFLEYWFRISEASITSYLEKLTHFIPFQKYSNSKYRQKCFWRWVL